MNTPNDWRLLLTAPYAPTPEDSIVVALRLAALKGGELLVDLGCGDGRVLITAVRDFGAKANGYEIQHKLVEDARRRIQSAGLFSDIQIFENDFFNEDLSGADVVFTYLTPQVGPALASKLGGELRSGSRVVAYRYPIRSWKPETITSDSSGKGLFLYAMPSS